MKKEQNDKNKRVEESKETMSSALIVAAKGFCVGGSMLVPGVSGGSMAMILGIYDKLIDAVSSFFQHVAWSIKFLALFSISAIVGMLLFAKPLLHLIDRFPMVMMYFFLGAVFGSIPMIAKKANVEKFHWSVIAYPLIGLCMMWLIAQLPQNLLSVEGTSSILRYIPMLLTGIVVAVALVLPGISVSYMLLVLGVYKDTVEAISNFDLLFLLPLGIGLVLGIILTTRLLEQAMNRYPGPTYLMILGFIIASCIDVFPGIPTGMSLLLAMLMFACGAYLVYRLSELEG